jgi:hypothetical protein
MRAIAKRLISAFAAGTPPIRFASLDVDFKRALLGYDGQ